MKQFQIITVVVCFTALFGFTVISNAQNVQAKEHIALELKLSVIVDSKPTKLRCELSNTSNREILITDIGIGHNKLIITTPGGKEIDNSVWEDIPIEKMIRIPPKGKKVWIVDIQDEIKDFEQFSNKSMEEGIYKIKWKISSKSVSNILYLYFTKRTLKK
jgi:hypothetical protein